MLEDNRTEFKFEFSTLIKQSLVLITTTRLNLNISTEFKLIKQGLVIDQTKSGINYYVKLIKQSLVSGINSLFL